MPACGLEIEGVWEQWAEAVSIVTRLNKVRRLVESPKPDVDMKACNNDCSHNSTVLEPLLRRMADDANWQLFNLKCAKQESLASRSTIWFNTPYSAISNVF